MNKKKEAIEKSVLKFKVEIWSRVHFNESIKKNDVNIFNGLVTHTATKEEKHFHSASDLLKILETKFFEQERKKKKLLKK